jgi:hypothetical protein
MSGLVHWTQPEEFQERDDVENSIRRVPGASWCTGYPQESAMSWLVYRTIPGKCQELDGVLDTTRRVPGAT